MKKSILLSFLLTLPFVSVSPSIGALISHARTALTKQFLEDVAFDSKGIDLQLDLAPVTLSYKARWGYRGAGDKTQAFTGFTGSVDLKFSYDGLTLEPLKLRSLRKKIKKYITPLLTISPLHEFYLKFFALIMSQVQRVTPNLDEASNDLAILFARLRKTEDGESASLPILGNIFLRDGNPGIATYFESAPRIVTNNLILISKRLLAGTGILSLKDNSAAYLQAVMKDIDYFNASDFTTTLPKGGTVHIPLGYEGSGLPHEPFSGTELTVDIPAKLSGGSRPVQWIFVLQPEYECLLRMAMLFMETSIRPLPSYRLSEEISTLLTRLSVTPLPEGSSTGLRDLLGVLCMHHQKIIHHDFSVPPSRSFSLPALIVQFIAILYKAYTMQVDFERNPESEYSKQDIVDFVTDQSAYALRRSQIFTRMQKRLTRTAGVNNFEDRHEVHVDFKRFLRKLLDEQPAQ